VDELDGADIDPARGLADEEDFRVMLDLSRQHDFLLVAAGEFGGPKRGIARPDIVEIHFFRGMGLDGSG